MEKEIPILSTFELVVSVCSFATRVRQCFVFGVLLTVLGVLERCVMGALYDWATGVQIGNDSMAAEGQFSVR